MHESLQTMVDTAASVRRSETRIHEAYLEAMGVAGDNPEHPSVLAVVQQNRLTKFEMHESVLDYYRNMPRTAERDPNVELAIYINVIIRGAFEDWHQDLQQRLRQS